MQNLFVRKVSHSSCIWNNVLVTFLFFSYLISFESRYLSLYGTGECCWVNAWLVSRWSFVSNLFRCQTIKLKFQSIMALLELQCGAVVMVPSPKTLTASDCSEVMFSVRRWHHPATGQRPLWGLGTFAQHDVVTVPLVTSINTTLKLFWQRTPQRDFCRKQRESLICCRSNVLQRKPPGLFSFWFVVLKLVVFLCI